MSPRRKKKTGGSGLRWLGPLLVAFLAGAVAVYFLISGGYLDPLGVDLTAAQQEELRQARIGLLTTMIDDQARWTYRDLADPPLEWKGTLPDSVSLVQWNARVSKNIQELGFEILAGREEVIPRAGRWPLQRLTLEIGSGGHPIGRVTVELPRSPRLPQAF